ncbi:hypothetical protein [Rhodococcus sp. WMMA185]|nr:hypothetical protein [Rhodococcus sp. WMMA185]
MSSEHAADVGLGRRDEPKSMHSDPEHVSNAITDTAPSLLLLP